MTYPTTVIKTKSKALKRMTKITISKTTFSVVFFKVPVLEGEPYGPPIFELAESSLPQGCFPSRDHVTNLKQL